MTALNSGWSFDGVALNSSAAYNIRLLSPSEEVAPRRGDNLLIPARPGRLWRPKQYEQRTISIAMIIRGDDAAGLQTNLETIMALFGRTGVRTLSRTMPDATVRTIDAEAIQTIFEPQSHLIYAAVIDLLAAEPWWQRTTAATVSSTGIGASPATINITNPGTAPHTAPTITIGGAITNPKLQIDDVWVQYTGTITGGNTLILQCGQFTATGGSPANITHGGDTSWMVIPAGASTATLTGTGLSSASIQLDYYPRYW